MLSDKGIQVISLDLHVADLSSSEGKLMLQLFRAFAEFEKNRIRERTKEGLDRARKAGATLGRPKCSGQVNLYNSMGACSASAAIGDR